MPPGPRQNAKTRLSAERKLARLKALARSTISETMAAKLHSSTLPSNTSDAASAIVQTIAEFSMSARAERRSRQFHYAAVGKAYDIWLRIEALDQATRFEVYRQLEGRRRGRPSDGIGILLDRVIDYSRETTSARQKRSRDASVIRYAAKIGWSAAGFSKNVAQCGGLEATAKLERNVRRAAQDSSEGPKPESSLPASTSEATGPERASRAKIHWGGLRRRAFARAHHDRDLIIIARANVRDRSLTVSRVMVGATTHLDGAIVSKLLHDGAFVATDGDFSNEPTSSESEDGG